MAQGVDSEHDFSILGMVAHADPVVQGIAGLLVLCSVASWAIMLEKAIRLRGLASASAALEALAAQGRLPPPETDGLGGAIAQAALGERADGASPGESRTDVRSRLERAMRAALKGELRSIETGLPFLATVGASTPFVGLLGTVWGIMHSFTSIAQSHDTSLAVVAPGIAEALFVTALGLFAAIPAVVGYNQITVLLGRAAERVSKTIVVLAKALTRPDADKVVSLKGAK